MPDGSVLPGPPAASLARTPSPPPPVSAGRGYPRQALPPEPLCDDGGHPLPDRIAAWTTGHAARAERALLRAAAAGLDELLPPGCALVEYGAESEGRALTLLQHLRTPACYVPVGAAKAPLLQLRARMGNSHPALAVYPVLADVLRAPALPLAARGACRLGLVPHAVLGALDPAAARDFLARVARALGHGALLLAGVDLRKPAARLLADEDDPEEEARGPARPKRDAGAEPDPGAFARRRLWNAAAGRVETHLVSLRDQVVHLGGREVSLATGESIHVASSYKHTPEGFARLAAAAGWHGARVWTDAERLFSLHLLRRGDAHLQEGEEE